MILPEKEYFEYLDLHVRLIYYVGQKKKLIPQGTTFEEFKEYDVNAKIPSRDAVYENIDMLEGYIQSRATELSEEQKEIVRGFKHFRRGKFYLLKLLKKHAVFMGSGSNYVYAVHALGMPFEDFVGRRLPMMVSAVLLPFRGKIVFDGILTTHGVYFGAGLRKSLKAECALNESKYGLITELPEKIDKESNSLENELLAMMKTQSSREQYWYKIEVLLDRNPELMPTYIRAWGRINSRTKKKEMRELGIKKQHFAIYKNTIIAAEVNLKALERKVARLVLDKKKREAIFYFKM